LTERPVEDANAVPVDPLSAVLRAVRLRGAIYFRVDTAPPWRVAAPPGMELAPRILPGSQHLIEYHVVTRGTCFGGLLDGEPVELHAGDVLVFPHGDAHVLSSTRELCLARRPDELEDVRRLLASEPERRPIPVRLGPEGTSQTELVCGFLGCDARPFNPLIEALPRVLHVRGEDDAKDPYLGSLIALTLAESSDMRAGSECMLAGLSELMFIEVVRRHLRSLPAERAGWLAGLRDPVVGRALSLLHARPAHPWSLDGLARAASVSRSVLAERFKRFVGQSPMQYLTRWRMQVATGMLADGNKSVGEVAYAVGYAFGRAFKKLVGDSPASWRDG